MGFEKMNSISLQGKHENNRVCPGAKIFGNALKGIGKKKQDQIMKPCLTEIKSVSKGATSGLPCSLGSTSKISSEASKALTDIDHPSYQNECVFPVNNHSDFKNTSNDENSTSPLCDTLKFQCRNSLLTSKHIIPSHLNIQTDVASNDSFPQYNVKTCKYDLAVQNLNLRTLNSNCQRVQLSNWHEQFKPTGDNKMLYLEQGYDTVSLADGFRTVNSRMITTYEKDTRTDYSLASIHKEANLQSILQPKNQTKSLINNIHPQLLASSDHFSTQYINNDMESTIFSQYDIPTIMASSNTDNKYVDNYKNNIAYDSKMTTSMNIHASGFNGSFNNSSLNLKDSLPQSYSNYFGEKSKLSANHSINNWCTNSLDPSSQYSNASYQDNNLCENLPKMCYSNLNHPLSSSTNAAETSPQSFINDYQSITSYNSNIAIPSKPIYLRDLLSSQTVNSSYSSHEHVVYNSEDDLSPKPVAVESEFYHRPLESGKCMEVSQHHDNFKLLTKFEQSSKKFESDFAEPSFYASRNNDKLNASHMISFNSIKPFTDRFSDYDTDELSSSSEEEILENKEIDNYNFNSGVTSENLKEKSPAVKLFPADRIHLEENPVSDCEEDHSTQSFLPNKSLEFPPVTANSSANKRNGYLPTYPVQRLLTFRSSGFIDSHCHIDLILKRNNFIGSYADFRKKHLSEFPINYKGCVAIFCYPETFAKKYMWKKHLNEENVWASFGCHPKRADSYNDYIEKALCVALEHPQVRALGEIGLDYSNGNTCLVNIQQSVFMRQIQIAINKKLPLVIHCRDAYEDCLHIMKLMIPKDYKIHMHCFKGSWEWAEKFMDEFPNLCIGITNVVTFPGAKLVHEVAKRIPLNRLLLETDAPYFVPNALSENVWSHPGMAIHVAAQITILRGATLREVLHYTLQNTKRIYGV